jgi:hypothetical protein
MSVLEYNQLLKTLTVIDKDSFQKLEPRKQSQNDNDKDQANKYAVCYPHAIGTRCFVVEVELAGVHTTKRTRRHNAAERKTQSERTSQSIPLGVCKDFGRFRARSAKHIITCRGVNVESNMKQSGKQKSTSIQRQHQTDDFLSIIWKGLSFEFPRGGKRTRMRQ